MKKVFRWLLKHPAVALVLAVGLYVLAFVIAESGDEVALLIGLAVLAVGFVSLSLAMIGIWLWVRDRFRRAG